jgi:hypothetical protein
LEVWDILTKPSAVLTAGVAQGEFRILLSLYFTLVRHCRSPDLERMGGLGLLG